MFCTHLVLPPCTSTTAPNIHFQVRSELKPFRLDTPFPPATATLRMGHRHTKFLQDASFHLSQVSPWYLSPLLFWGDSCGKPHTDLLGKDNDGAVPHTLSQLHAPAADREGRQPQFWMQPHAQGVLQCGPWHLEAGGRREQAKATFSWSFSHFQTWKRRHLQSLEQGAACQDWRGAEQSKEARLNARCLQLPIMLVLAEQVFPKSHPAGTQEEMETFSL